MSYFDSPLKLGQRVIYNGKDAIVEKVYRESPKGEWMADLIFNFDPLDRNKGKHEFFYKQSELKAVQQHE